MFPKQAKHRLVEFHPQSQTASGLATLMFCFILLTSATTLIFTLARTSLAEQRIVGNEYHAEILRQACEAGLEYGLHWLRQHTPVWQMDSNGQHIASAPLPADNLGLHGHIRVQIDYLSQDINSPFIQIHAQTWRLSNDTNEDTGTTLCSMVQYVHYLADNTPGNVTGSVAQVISVPGTWHDYD
jgi:Tfp pilus assembly protein PilX